MDRPTKQRTWPVILGLAWLAAPAFAQAAPSAHYALKARMDAPAGRLAATLTVTLPEDAGETDFVLADRFKIERLETSPGGTTEVAATDTPMAHLQRIAVRFPGPPATHSVTFVYSGPINQAGEDTPALSPERIELDLETMWLPARQDLAMPFTVDAEISGLPADLTVLSQGRLSRNGDRLVIHREDAENDMPLDGAIGLTLMHAPDVDFWAADQNDPLVAMLRKHAFGAAAFYRGLYGAPDPDPVRMVIVPRGDGAGYGERSFVVMPTFRKPGAPTPPFDESSPARFVAHEFRHAWMPNIEGIPPDSVWLSESVAEYFGLRYGESVLGVKDRDAVLERKRKTLADAGPLIGLGKKPSKAALYNKGPILLFELEAQIGRPVLDRILVRPDPPLDTPTFLHDLAEVAGPDVARAFEAKLR